MDGRLFAPPLSGPEGLPEGFWESLKNPVEAPEQPFRILDFDVVLNLPDTLARGVRGHMALQEGRGEGVRGHRVRVLRSPKPQFQGASRRPLDYHIVFLQAPSALEFYAYHFAGRIPLDGGEPVLALGEAAEDHLITEVENFLRVYAAFLLLREQAFLLHSSAAVVEGEAVVFFGHSGAGKSTSALLCQEAGHPVLSDDLNILCERGGRWCVQASPFISEIKSVQPGLFPVRRLFFLYKAKQNGIDSVPRPLQMAYLFSNLVVVNAIPGLHGDIVRVLDRLLPQVPVTALHFKNDKEFVPWLRSHW